MRPVSDKQFVALLGALVPNVDLDALNPEMVQRAIRDPGPLATELTRLINAGCAMVEPSNIWRTVEIGRHKNAETMVGVLESADCKVSRWARDILNKVIFAQKGLQTLQLVCLTVAELGFPKGATREQIYEAARKRDLYLCPAEVGPALREQYNDQPTGKWLLIAMEPIADSDGGLFVFDVARDSGGSWLDTNYGCASRRWSPSVCWVFCSSKP